MNTNQFRSLSAKAMALTSKFNSLRTEMLVTIDAYIDADLIAPLGYKELENMKSEVDSLILQAGLMNTPKYRDACKAHTKHKNNLGELKKKHLKKASKYIASTYGKSMFTAEDIINGSLNVADGIICIHRGEILRNIGISIRVDIQKIKNMMTNELIEANAGITYLATPINHWDRVIKESVELDNIRLESKTYRENKDMFKALGMFNDFVPRSNAIARDMALINIDISRYQTRTPIFNLESVSSEAMKIIKSIHLAIRKVGSKDYTGVDPKSIKVYQCSLTDENRLLNCVKNEDSILLSKVNSSKYPIDLGTLT